MILAAVCLTVGAPLSGPAAAAEVCDLHSTVVAHLAGKYGETRIAFGIGTNGELVEVFNNEKKDTWTITVTAPGGPACMVAAGKGWHGWDALGPSPPRREMAL